MQRHYTGITWADIEKAWVMYSLVHVYSVWGRWKEHLITTVFCTCMHVISQNSGDIEYSYNLPSNDYVNIFVIGSSVMQS